MNRIRNYVVVLPIAVAGVVAVSILVEVMITH
jgi:hypothetical protein